VPVLHQETEQGTSDLGAGPPACSSRSRRECLQTPSGGAISPTSCSLQACMQDLPPRNHALWIG